VFLAADFRFDPIVSSRAASTRADACSLSARSRVSAAAMEMPVPLRKRRLRALRRCGAVDGTAPVRVSRLGGAAKLGEQLA